MQTLLAIAMLPVRAVKWYMEDDNALFLIAFLIPFFILPMVAVVLITVLAMFNIH